MKFLLPLALVAPLCLLAAGCASQLPGGESRLGGRAGVEVRSQQVSPLVRERPGEKGEG